MSVSPEVAASSHDPSAGKAAALPLDDVPATPGGWRRWLPWVGTGVLLAWIVATTDVAAFFAAMRQADWSLFLGGMCVLYTLQWLVDSLSIHWLYRRFAAPAVELRGLLAARGATYLLGILNYALGNAVLAAWFRRRYGVSLVASGATMVLLMAVDLGLLVLVVVAGAAMLPDAWRLAAIALGAAFALGAIAHLVFWRAPWRWGPLERIRERPEARGFREATLRDYAVLGVLRSPVSALYIAMHLVTLRAFGIHVPLLELFVYVPLQMVVAALPISVSGLGTVTALQRVLYAPFVDAPSPDIALATIDAYGIALFVGFVVPRIVIGVLSLRSATA